MKKRYTICICILLSLCSLVCGNGRPDETEAKKVFEKIYPGVVVESVRISEDEVVARSFEYQYRKGSSSETKKIEIQFMEINGVWKPSPLPPTELP